MLDTNVISEPLRAAHDARVVAWLDAQPVAELRFGVVRLPSGRRRNGLIEQLERQVLPAFAGRILNFDLLATQHYLHRSSVSAAIGGIPSGFRGPAKAPRYALCFCTPGGRRG